MPIRIGERDSLHYDAWGPAPFSLLLPKEVVFAHNTSSPETIPRAREGARHEDRALYTNRFQAACGVGGENRSQNKETPAPYCPTDLSKYGRCQRKLVNFGGLVVSVVVSKWF
jgi:hypothetical protein